MKRRCPYCGIILKGKDLESHIYESHSGLGKKFYCREGCVRCCTDIGAPLELVLSDIERISAELNITNEQFLKRYGGVLWSNIPGTSVLIPSTGLPFPCRFLKNEKCSIYDIRPLHCRLFPERLYVQPSPQDFEPFFGSRYVCVDEGVYLTEDRVEDIKEMMRKDEKELLRTARFFKNEEYVYELTTFQQESIQKILSGISPRDPDRNRKKRHALEAMIPQDVKDRAWKDFLFKLREH